MDTLSFFKRILPSEGKIVLAELVPTDDKPRWKYYPYDSRTVAAEAAAQLDSTNRTIYHACNSFGDWYFDEKKNKRRLRTQENVQFCRSFYDDIDVGKEGCYATRAEAGAALKTFLKASGLPTPLLVSSGGGFHLYWTLDENTTPEVWLRVARKKRLGRILHTSPVGDVLPLTFPTSSARTFAVFGDCIAIRRR